MTVLKTLAESVSFIQEFDKRLGDYPLIVIGTHTHTVVMERKYKHLAKQELSNMVNYQNLMLRYSDSDGVFPNPIRVDFVKQYSVGSNEQ